MQLSADCMLCLLKHQARMVENYQDEVQKAAFIQAAMKMIGEAGREISAPYMTLLLNQLHERFFGFGEDMTALKQTYNARMLKYEDEIMARIDASDDPLRAAVRYTCVGNYIDFGAMETVGDDALQEIIDNALKRPFGETELENLRRDLASAKRFVLVADNAGEIVMDKLLIRTLAKLYPSLQPTVLVRGALTSNDATIEDAREVGLPGIARVIGNGTAIAGTEMNRISDEARAALQNADVIFAKGQGNFETLLGCGLNVYYVFLTKCSWFMRQFDAAQFTGMLVSERRVRVSQFLDGEAPCAREAAVRRL